MTAVGGHFGPFGTTVEIPATHAAHRLLADGFPTDDSRELGPEAICADSDWRICLVLDDGILAVVAFGNAEGTAVTLEGRGLSEGFTALPAAGETVIGVESPGGLITATVLVAGEWAGELSGTLTENNS